MIRRFLALNRRMSRAVEGWLPSAFTRHLHTVYKYDVAAAVNRRPGQTVLDIGAGRECPFLRYVSDPAAHLIVALDCADHELRFNRDLSQKIVADAASPAFPFRAGSVDVIASRSVVEHLHDNAAFFANCARALQPGGTIIHTFPCGRAPFSLVNRILPNAISKRLIAYFHPDWAEECGFLAHYDLCNFSAIRDVLHRNGFEDCKFEFRYYQSIYFDFFLSAVFYYGTLRSNPLAIGYQGLSVRNFGIGFEAILKTLKPAPVSAYLWTWAKSSPSGTTG